MSVYVLYHHLLALLLLLLTSYGIPGLCCYTSIFSFGDSLADTGNLLYLEGDHPSVKGRYPYGMTYFHHPTGRCSDGRLIIDFIAQSLGFPLLPPYLVPTTNGQDFRQGVNFAVAGATALNYSFYKSRNIYSPFANYSLTIQVGWFKELLSSLCDPSSDCRDFLSRSQFVMGEIGGDDYYYPFVDGLSKEEVRSFAPLVIKATSEAIQTLIANGAQTFMVSGNLPIGCSSMYLTMFQTPNKEMYDPESGCLNWLNEFAEYHNHLLQRELNRLRKLHPHTTIIYADYYNAAMPLYRYPTQFGFSELVLKACCGGGDPYNMNTAVRCGEKGSRVCEDPSLFVSWDGPHLTEAAYKIIATTLLDGSYTIPPFNASCLAPEAMNVDSVGFHLPLK